MQEFLPREYSQKVHTTSLFELLTVGGKAVALRAGGWNSAVHGLLYPRIGDGLYIAVDFYLI